MQTFLFTDVEGSTRLWERHPAAMSVAIERQEAILRHEISVRGGTVFNTAGDSVCAVFASPGQAVAAAVAAQRTLLAEPWHALAPDLRILVRMAIDTGEVHSAEGSYLGPALNQLHRLMKTGHGGQILCGSAVAEAISGEGTVSLHYLSSHALRDVSGETRIYQIDAPGLPEKFPRLIVDRPASTRLPYQPAAIFGRESDLERIGALLRDRASRLVTLLGPGGVGKTTLAVALARQLDDAFPDGVHFVDLSALRDAPLVVSAIAGILQIEDPLLTPEEALIAGLRSRELLLVLDNCEQVVEEVARLTGRLIAETPGTTVLATSRVPLRTAPELEARVEPLPLPDDSEMGRSTEAITAIEDNPAVQLFREHATQVNARFTLTEHSRPAVVDICRLVDGLPLAIELAAAWVRILDPTTLRDRLATGAPLLRSDARDRPERHRTLASTIDWSYQLLDPETRSAFGRLAVFQGGIPLDGALAVLQADERATFIDALDQLDQLVQANLLQPPIQTPDGPRYTMLQTIQEFARDTLSAEDRLTASRAHADFFASIATSAELHYRGPQAAIWFDRLGANLENLRTAILWLADCEAEEAEKSLRMTMELWEFFDVRGLHVETRALLSQSLAAAPNAPALDRARALALLGHASLSNYEQAEEFYRRSLEVAAESSDDSWQMAAALGLGMVSLLRGDVETSLQSAREVLSRCRSANDAAALAQALLVLGQTLEFAGQFEDAEEPLYESIELSTQIGDIGGVAWAHRILASVLLGSGAHEQAEDFIRKAIAEFEEIGERIMIALCHLDLARILLQTGTDPDIGIVAGAVEDLARSGDVFIASFVLDAGAQVLAHFGDQVGALEILGAADGWRRTTGTTRSTVMQAQHATTLQRASHGLDSTLVDVTSGRGHMHSMRSAMLLLQERLNRESTANTGRPELATTA